MKKLLLLAVVLVLSAAVAHAGEPPSAQPIPAPGQADVFLAELSGIASETPEPIFLATCEISRECVCGGGYETIYCVGDVSCEFGFRSVVCDGVATYCPPIGSCPP